MVYSELVTGLCTALTFACAVQIIITCFLSFAFSQFMPILQCNVTTTAGVLAGLVTVPTIIQLRASQASSHVGRKYGYTIWYKRLAIGACASLQTVAWLCTLINISKKYDENTFLDLMKYYIKNQSSKSIIDNLQWFLQCCGSNSYKDWYNIDWGGFVFDTNKLRRKKSISELLFGDTDDYPDLSTVRTDAVPFSCCSENAKTACIHQNLQQLGAYTINTDGCNYKLAATKQSILALELVIYTVCLILEITILCFLKSPSDVEEVPSKTKLIKPFHSDEKPKFERFLNQVESPSESE